MTRPNTGHDFRRARRVASADFGDVEHVLCATIRVLDRSVLSRSAATVASSATVALGSLVPASIQLVECVDRLASAAERIADSLEAQE